MGLLSREIELYDFFIGNRHWRYTDVDRDAVVGGIKYTSARGLKRSRFVQSPEETKNLLEITAPLNLGVLSIFRPYPPMARVHLEVRVVRVSDGTVRDAWSGIVSDVSEIQTKDALEAVIRAQTLMAAVSANGLRRVWQVSCPLALYGKGVGQCNVNEELYRTDATVEISSGLTLKAPELASKENDWFKGGFIRWLVEGEFEYRFIVSHTGDTLKLLTPAAIPKGVVVGAFPGCNHLMGHCGGKFNNEHNYGGQHTIPKKNPFSNETVF